MNRNKLILKMAKLKWISKLENSSNIFDNIFRKGDYSWVT
jgi:hypothetical protein